MLFRLGPLNIRYYSVMLVIGIIIIYYIFSYLVKKKGIDLKQEDIFYGFFWSIIGGVIATRLFYVLFYNLDYYLANPLKVFATWEGGISFHGAFIGVIAVSYIYCRIKKIDYLTIADLFLIPVALALFIGRIANFINAELVGRITDVPWAVNFNGETNDLGELVYRHPSQLYESAKNLLIFGMLWVLNDRNLKKGTIVSLFMIMYSILRFFVEFFRQPDPQLGFLVFRLTMGQIINVFMLMIGVSLILYIYLKKE